MRTLRASGELEAGSAAERRRISGSLLTLRAFRTQLDLDVRRARRYRRPLSVALLDLDSSQALASPGGHAGDAGLLAAVDAVIARTTRAHDLACRAGGGEFVILLAETASGNARVTVERLLAELEGIEVAGPRGVSASAGVADLTAAVTPEGLLAAARDALDGAREAGGGRVAECPPGVSASRRAGLAAI